MIAQTYCGRLREFPLLCNPEDGPCPSCLRAHIARLEAALVEAEAARIGVEELEIYRGWEKDARAAGSDTMRWDELIAVNALDALRAAKGGAT